MAISAAARKYYKETDWKKRGQLLEELIREEGMTEENALRRKIYDGRYGTGRKRGKADLFMRGWMSLDYLQSGGGFFRTDRMIRKEMAGIRKDWQLSAAEEYGRIGEELLQEEFRNLTHLCIEISRKSRMGGSNHFGAGSGDHRPLGQAMEDEICRLAYEVPKLLGAEEELVLFTRAASREFCEQFPERTDGFYRRVMG